MWLIFSFIYMNNIFKDRPDITKAMIFAMMGKIKDLPKKYYHAAEL